MARTFGGISNVESLVITAITDGSYFVYNETPAGAQTGVNDTFTLLSNPNPAGSLLLRKNGQVLTAGGVDYTLSGDSVVYVAAQIPVSDDVVKCDYSVSPV